MADTSRQGARSSPRGLQRTACLRALPVVFQLPPMCALSRRPVFWAAGWMPSLASRLPPLEPPPKRLLGLSRSAARQEALHTDIFIQIRPVDTLASPNQTPLPSLAYAPLCQAWEPGQRNRDRPAVSKVHDQSIIAHRYALCHWLYKFSPGSTHAMPSVRNPRSARSVARSGQSPCG